MAKRRARSDAGHARAAARGQGDRHQLRLGRRGQDDHGGGRGGDGRHPPRRQGARAHRRPGPAPGQRAGPRGVRQRRDAGAARGVRSRRASSLRGELWAAMLDTKQSLGRPRAPPRARRRAPRDAHPRQPALPEHHRASFVQSHDYIAMERLYEIHTAGTLRPDRRRHAAHAERHRLPRGARAHGRLLQQPAAALAHRAVPRRGR